MIIFSLLHRNTSLRSGTANPPTSIPHEGTIPIKDCLHLRLLLVQLPLTIQLHLKRGLCVEGVKDAKTAKDKSEADTAGTGEAVATHTVEKGEVVLVHTTRHIQNHRTVC